MVIGNVLIFELQNF